MPAERRRAIWSVLFLVLSQTFGGTLQCVTSSAHHPKEPLVRPGNNFHDDYDSTTTFDETLSQAQGRHYGSSSLEEDPNEERLSSSSELLHVENPYFPRVSRGEDRSSHAGHAQAQLPLQPGADEDSPVHKCGKRLKTELDMLCGQNNFHTPIPSFANSAELADGTLRKTGKRSMRGHESSHHVPRNVVEQCCINPCSQKDMLKYCGSSTSTIDTLVQSNKVEVNAEPTDGTPATELAENQEPNSALLYPLFHIINLLHRQFTKSIPTEEVPYEDPSFPRALARVQGETSSSSRYRYPSEPNFSKAEHSQRFPHASAGERTRGVESSHVHHAVPNSNHQSIYARPQETNDILEESEYDEDKGTASFPTNAVTSTLPSRIFRIGKITNYKK